MGEITFYQKNFPDDIKSMRMDHSDLPDVQGTTFAKGVITDFEKIKNDPIQVKSRVKVKVSGNESQDYIPIFFHPKPQYWDDEDGGKLATDFNEDGKYFEKAWMSFRCGDEVVVMVRKNFETGKPEPFAVIGFADGVPRIGENIIKRECAVTLSDSDRQVIRFDCLKQKYHYDYDNDVWLEYGPDGADLQLLKESEMVTNLNGNRSATWSATSGYLPDQWIEYTSADGYFYWDGTVWRFECYSFLTVGTDLSLTTEDDIYVNEFIIPVGPILYLVQVLSAIVSRKERQYTWEGCKWIGPYGTVLAGIYFVGGQADSYEDLPDQWQTINIKDVVCKAGVYSPELVDLIRNGTKKNPGDQYDS